MATLGPVYADSFMECRMSRLTCHGVPLPYLIRPRRVLPPIDTFDFYNDYSDDESDGEDSSMEAVETSSLNKGHLVNDEEDEEYVVVNHAEAVPNSKTERAGAIQMMELSKDMVDDDESESEDAGSDSDDWVVV